MNLQKLLSDLRFEEGWRSRPYRDSEGYLTIGYGFLIDEGKSVELPRDVGEMWLEVAANERWEALQTRIPWVKDQPDDVQTALAHMAYQMGVDGVLGFRKMLTALRENDRRRAADEALDSEWARQTPARAERVAEMIRGS